MSRAVEHGGIATSEKKKFSFWQLYFTREGWLVRKFRSLKRSGVRATPGAVVIGDCKPFEVLRAPAFFGEKWVLSEGKQVTSEQILELDSVRLLAGYSA